MDHVTSFGVMEVYILDIKGVKTMQMNGTIIICDRCKKEKFFKEGTSFLTISKDYNTGPDHKDLCVECYEQYKDLTDNFMQIGAVREKKT